MRLRIVPEQKESVTVTSGSSLRGPVCTGRRVGRQVGTGEGMAQCLRKGEVLASPAPPHPGGRLGLTHAD